MRMREWVHGRLHIVIISFAFACSVVLCLFVCLCVWPLAGLGYPTHALHELSTFMSLGAALIIENDVLVFYLYYFAFFLSFLFQLINYYCMWHRRPKKFMKPPFLGFIKFCMCIYYGILLPEATNDKHLCVTHDSLSSEFLMVFWLILYQKGHYV